MHIDRVQASQNLHTLLCLVIATLDHHERATAAHPLRIGIRLILRRAKGYERLHQLCSRVRDVPLGGRVVGRAALRVMQRQMDITPCKAVREQRLDHTLRLRARVI
jgi:hypothetical protein